jgi:hypothetical protein
MGRLLLMFQQLTSDTQHRHKAVLATSCCACLQEVRKGGGSKGKKGSKGKAGSEAASSSSSMRLKPCASFFRFFLPDSSKGSKVPKHLHDPTALHEDDDEEEVSCCWSYAQPGLQLLYSTVRVCSDAFLLRATVFYAVIYLVNAAKSL